MSYHIAKSGKSAPCAARPGMCPLGGQHFPDKDTADFYVETQATLTSSLHSEGETRNVIKREARGLANNASQIPARRPFPAEMPAAPAPRNCTTCGGTGYRMESYPEVETDLGQSIAMGAGLGTGYFPMTRTVYKQRRVTCNFCNGTGKSR